MSSVLRPLETSRFRLLKGDFVEVSGSGTVDVSFPGVQRRIRIRTDSQTVGPYESDADCTITTELLATTFTVNRERETRGPLPVTYDPESGHLIAGGQSISSDGGTVLNDTDDLPEGGTNLYFTDERAKTAAQIGEDTQNTSRTLTADDVGKVLKCTSGSAIDLTIPADADVTWPDGPVRVFKYQGGAGVVSFVAAGGVTLRNPLAYASQQYVTEGVQRVGANEWAFL